MEKTITLKLPGPSEPGFFKHLRQQAAFFAVMEKPAGHSPSEVDEALDWLVSLADAKDKDAARAAIRAMSAEQINDLLLTLRKAEPEVDPNS